MKNYLIFIVLFLISIFVIDRIVVKFLDMIYQEIKTGQSGGRINYYLTLEQIPEILVMGSSRVQYQIDPAKFILSGYNIGHGGMDDVFQLGLLSIIINAKKEPSILLLHIDPDIYQGSEFSEIKPVDIQNLKYYYGKNEIVTRYTNELSKFEKYKFALKLYRYNGRVINMIKNFLQTKIAPIINDNGYEPWPPSVMDSINVLYSSRQNPAKRLHFREDKVKYLVEIIQLCKSNNIKLICFTTPYYYKNLSVLNQTRKYLDSLFSKNNIVYLDLSREKIKELGNPKYWKDATHVNAIGAEIVSANLSDRLVPLFSD
ncbi:MAG: hypothetical protein FVQ77_13215 [Cytophagales bacterium]|nr:hypothetical protein [Cytophagales bacterium]